MWPPLCVCVCVRARALVRARSAYRAHAHQAHQARARVSHRVFMARTAGNRRRAARSAAGSPPLALSRSCASARGAHLSRAARARRSGAQAGRPVARRGLPRCDPAAPSADPAGPGDGALTCPAGQTPRPRTPRSCPALARAAARAPLRASGLGIKLGWADERMEGERRGPAGEGGDRGPGFDGFGGARCGAPFARGAPLLPRAARAPAQLLRLCIMVCLRTSQVTSNELQRV